MSAPDRRAVLDRADRGRRGAVGSAAMGASGRRALGRLPGMMANASELPTCPQPQQQTQPLAA